MGIAVSLVMMVVGAVLTFAVQATFAGTPVSSLGIILLVTGGAGLLMEMWLTERHGPRA